MSRDKKRSGCVAAIIYSIFIQLFIQYLIFRDERVIESYLTYKLHGIISRLCNASETMTLSL